MTWNPAVLPSAPYTPQAAVDALLAATLAPLGTCGCGRVLDGAGHCRPCENGNPGPAGAFYEAAPDTAALRAENARLKGRVAELEAAAVRAGKGGAG